MKRVWLGTVAAALALGLGASASAQPVCDPPQVMLTVDKSSSMLGELPSGMTKWQAARTAIGEVTGTFSDRIHFGLQPFPYPSLCSPGAVTIRLGWHTSAEILEGLGDPPPTGGNYTPMAQTLRAAGDYTPLTDASRDNHLVLITDGWQWCDPYDPATRFDPVGAVSALRDLSITVHVVGFGAAVDALTLNRAAVAAGTALPGCDPTGSDPADPGHCYMQADDLSELRAILDDIGTSITEEVCDGVDNDCDGTIDEGFDEDGDGVTTCEGDCDDSDDSIRPGAEEVCDERDNDCDGSTDPGCSCVDGDSRACGSDTGACSRGTQRCVDGSWGDCTGGTSPEATDGCDGVDEDCDGEVDEDADCAGQLVCRDGECVDLTEPGPDPDPDPEPTGCTTGEMRPCRSDIGACTFGTEVCEAGAFGECIGGLGPAPNDGCDGVDNDCDAEVDEDATCGPGQECREGTCVTTDRGDSGTPIDAGPPTTGVSEDGGCGCRTTGDTASGSAALLVLMVGVSLRRRRRHR